MAADKGTSADAAVPAVSSELDGIFTLGEEQKLALETFLGGQHVSSLLLLLAVTNLIGQLM